MSRYCSFKLGSSFVNLKLCGVVTVLQQTRAYTLASIDLHSVREAKGASFFTLKFL
jgi:hypothetical protein